jgi:hypothetical protein
MVLVNSKPSLLHMSQAGINEHPTVNEPNVANGVDRTCRLILHAASMQRGYSLGAGSFHFMYLADCYKRAC